jgi:hypothetical protein
MTWQLIHVESRAGRLRSIPEKLARGSIVPAEILCDWHAIDSFSVVHLDQKFLARARSVTRLRIRVMVSIPNFSTDQDISQPATDHSVPGSMSFHKEKITNRARAEQPKLQVFRCQRFSLLCLALQFRPDGPAQESACGQLSAAVPEPAVIGCIS